MDWNDPIDVDFAWSATAWLNLLDRAIWEREFAQGIATTPAGPPYAARFAAGDAVQQAALLSQLQGRIEALLDVGASAAGAGRWIDPAWDPTASTAASLDADFESHAYGEAGAVSRELGYSEGAWRRKCLRTCPGTPTTTGVSATEDAEGNAAAAGQAAWVKVFVSPARWELRRHDGTAWNAPAGVREQADLLSSDEAAPNAARPLRTLGGDLIGLWIFRQMRDVLNQLTRLGVTNGVLTPPPISAVVDMRGGNNGVGGPWDTYEHAKAAAIATYPHWPYSIYGSDQHHGPFSYCWAQFNGTDYLAELAKNGVTYSVGLAHHCSRTVRWYAGVTKPTDLTSGAWTFDAQGDGFAEDSVALWKTLPVTAVNPVTAKFNDPSVLPVNWPADAGTGFGNMAGYEVSTDQYVIVDWAVSGGFVCLGA